MRLGPELETERPSASVATRWVEAHSAGSAHLKNARLAEYSIIIDPEKCQFITTELSFLGHHERYEDT